MEPLAEEFAEFFEEKYSKEAGELALGYPTKRSLEVSYASLDRFSASMADELLLDPDAAIAAAEVALRKLPLGTMEFGFEPHVRFTDLPESSRVSVEDLGAAHIGKLISVDCVVTKRTEVQPKVKVAVLRCRLCDARFKILVDKNTTILPETCDSCKRRALECDEEHSEYVDLQRIEVQEPIENLRGAAPSSRVAAWMEDDLVNTVLPGQRLVITGIMRLKPPTKKQENAFVYRKYVEVVHAAKLEKDFEEIDATPAETRKFRELAKKPDVFDLIKDSIAPGIYGHDEVKQALALQLFGGTEGKKQVDGKSAIRAKIHVLILGDAGTAKTRLLQRAIEIAPKGLFVSGKSVSGVGLTASAERDELSDGGWVLKAGALVLAGGGLAAVDEIDKIDEDDRAAMHEVMESETISIAKAGIVAQFRAKTSIVAAGNPKLGRFDANAPIAPQYAIVQTLLSRFDLIFPIMDVLDETRDDKLADHVLNQHMLGGPTIASGAVGHTLDAMRAPMDTDLLRKYIAYARRRVHPALSPEAKDAIKAYYVDLRKAATGAVPITARYLDGLVRLSEASAKTRLSPTVETQDAKRAIFLVDYVLKTVMTDRTTGALDVDLVAGTPYAYAGAYRKIVAIVKGLEAEYDMVKVSLVIETAAEQGLLAKEAEKFINRAILEGDLVEPQKGFLASAKRVLE